MDETCRERKMDIPVDGLVICYDDTDYAASGSVTGHHATRAGFAFKWQDEAVDTKLKYIEWSCAVSTISPVAVFEPVQIEGTTVSRASLCNISEIERLGIGKECTLSVIKANKIIPKCIAVKDAVGAPEIPSQCPVCHAPTKVHVSETVAQRPCIVPIRTVQPKMSRNLPVLSASGGWISTDFPFRRCSVL